MLDRLQRKIPLVVAGLVLIEAPIALYLGVPAPILVPFVSLMLATLLLHQLWAKDSPLRMLGLMTAAMMLGLVLMWYFFHLPVFFLVVGIVLGLGVMSLNALWLKRSIADARAYLIRWATNNGGQLLEFAYRTSTGPFHKWPGRADLYFEFVVTDRQQQRHRGWLYVNGGWLGKCSPEMKWIETA